MERAPTLETCAPACASARAPVRVCALARVSARVCIELAQPLTTHGAGNRFCVRMRAGVRVRASARVFASVCARARVCVLVYVLSGQPLTRHNKTARYIRLSKRATAGKAGERWNGSKHAGDRWNAHARAQFTAQVPQHVLGRFPALVPMDIGYAHASFSGPPSWPSCAYACACAFAYGLRGLRGAGDLDGGILG